MPESQFDLDLEDLSSAEDFLDYFALEYDPKVVHVNRLHILQRFHDYLDAGKNMPENGPARFEAYRSLLSRAYEDFVSSDALTEKVFKVFQVTDPGKIDVPLSALGKPAKSGAP
ncbi:MAG: nitrogenase-stabilizing/protective protein NifW [Gammaproteobacteria bacterium]